jgi:4-amino-4-deoxy-L-arabinose transferase-like glycosyltransferase
VTLRRILVAAILVRAVLIAGAWARGGDSAVFVSSDTPQYLEPATRLATQGHYWNERGPEIFRPPGYGLLLVPGVWLGAPVLVVVLLQTLLGVATTGIVFGIGRRLGSPEAAIAGAAWFALEPLSLVLGAKLLSETLFTFLVALTLALAVGALVEGRARELLGAALAAAGAAFVRPIGYLLGPAVVFAVVALSARGRRPWRAAVLALVLWMLPVGAWHLRNGLTTGYWGFSTQLDRVIAFWIPASVEAAQAGRAYTEARADLRAREQQPGFETPHNLARLRRRGLEALSQHPLTYARVYARGISRSLLNPGALTLLSLFGAPESDPSAIGRVVTDRGTLDAVSGATRWRWPVIAAFTVTSLFLLGELFFAALGLLLSTAAWKGRLLTAGVALYFLLLSGGPSGASRFRHPMTPSLCALAGLGVARWRCGR